ncbi:MAG TPA: MBL fold metallo-hydrolase [Candidatus Aminicenantes bacterium]|nr:MBL fold metallo-hydrolase [Candidatus Aminicenantes bacterium]
MVQSRLIQPVSLGVISIQIPSFPVYLLRFDRSVLVDSGITTGVSTLSTALQELLPETDLDTLLLTHSHWDHAGGAFELQPQMNFSVKASHRAVELLQKPRVREFIHHLNREHALQNGAEPPAPYEPLKRLEALKENDRLDLDDKHWIQVYETPGHTRCSLAFLLYPEKVLFPGDAVGVVERDGSIKPLFLSDYGAYEASLEKLGQLDAECLCFAHNRVLRGKERVKSFLAASLERTRQVRDVIRQRLDAGMEREEIADVLYAEEFPRPTVMGPREALIINLRAMVLAVEREVGAS